MELNGNSFDSVIGLSSAKNVSDAESILLGMPLSKLKNNLFGSIEETKARLVQVIPLLSTDKDEIALKNALELIGEMNAVILRIIADKRKQITVLNSAESKINELEKLSIDSDKKALDAISGLYEIIKARDPDDFLLGYLDKEKQNITAIKQKLEQAYDPEKMTKLGLIMNSLLSVEKTITAQNKIVDKYAKKGKFEKFFKKKNYDLYADAQELLPLIRQELDADNEYLRYCFQVVDITDEKGKLDEIRWLSNQKIELEKDTKLMFNQFIIPKIEFASGHYTTYLVTPSRALAILKDGQISNDGLAIDKSKFRLASVKEALPSVTYMLDTVDVRMIDKDNGCGFLIPLEDIMRKHYFILKRQQMKISIYDVPGNASELLKRIEKDYNMFEIILSDIEKSHQQWIKEAQNVQKDLRKNWSETANNIIIKDFSKRWLKERADSLRDEQASQFDVVDYLTDVLWFESITSSQLEKAQGAGYDEEFIKPKDFIEQIYRMDKASFIDLVSRGKKFYEKVLSDVKTFLNKTNTGHPIKDAIFLAPKKHVLFWEKQFEKLGTRPNTFYYKGDDMDSAVKQAIEKCKTNSSYSNIPVAKDIKIYNSPFKSLQKL